MDEFLYVVKSQSGNSEYTVNKVDGEWYCACPDNTYRQVKCKHIFAVELSLKMKEQVKHNVVIQPLDASKCVYCGSGYIVKDAIRHKKPHLQYYLCKECGKRFSINIGFEGMKAMPYVYYCWWCECLRCSLKNSTIVCLLFREYLY